MQAVRSPAMIGNLARFFGHHVPLFRGGYYLIFSKLAGLVRSWPEDLTIAGADGLTFVHCDLNQHIYKELFVFGVHEKDVDWMSNQLLQPGDTFIDVGANFGFHTIRAAVRVGAQGLVYAIEPQPDVLGLLRENLLTNGIHNVSVDELALGEKAGTLELHRFPRLGAGSTSIAKLDEEESQPISCPSMTLDAYMESKGIDKVKLVKLDVEGSELPILNGARKLLSSPCPPMWIVEINFETARACGYEPEDMLALLRSHGYSIYKPVWGKCIRNVKGVEHTGQVQHGNNVLAAIDTLHGKYLNKVRVN